MTGGWGRVKRGGGERALLGEMSAALSMRAPRRAGPGSYESHAAVCLLLRRAGDGIEFLVIKRAEREGDPWSGHYALPGGRREEGDVGLWETAVRETLEEVGVDLTRAGTLLGQLDDVVPGTRRIPAIAITPYVVEVSDEAVARTSSEVESVVWLPLGVLVEEKHRGKLKLEALPGREFPTIEYGGHVIWGLTLAILSQVRGVLERVGYAGGAAD